MSTPQSWSGGSGRQADEVGWSRKVTEMGQGTDKDEKGKKGGHTMTHSKYRWIHRIHLETLSKSKWDLFNRSQSLFGRSHSTNYEYNQYSYPYSTSGRSSP